MKYRIVLVPVPDDTCGCDRGWVHADDGVMPCPSCRPAQHTAWLQGRYRTAVADR